MRGLACVLQSACMHRMGAAARRSSHMPLPLLSPGLQPLQN